MDQTGFKEWTGMAQKQSLYNALLRYLTEKLQSRHLTQVGSWATAAKKAVVAMRKGDRACEIPIPTGETVTALDLCHELELWEYVENETLYPSTKPKGLTVLGIQQGLHILWCGVAWGVAGEMVSGFNPADDGSWAIASVVFSVVTQLVGWGLGLLLLKQAVQGLTQRFASLFQEYPTPTKGFSASFSGQTIGVILLVYTLHFGLFCLLLTIFERIFPKISIASHNTLLFTSVALVFLVNTLPHITAASLNYCYISIGQGLFYGVLQLLGFAFNAGVLWGIAQYLPQFLTLNQPIDALLMLFLVSGGRTLITKLFKIFSLESFLTSRFSGLGGMSQWVIIGLLFALPALVIFPAVFWITDQVLSGVIIPGYWACVILAVLESLGRIPYAAVTEKLENNFSSYFGGAS